MRPSLLLVDDDVNLVEALSNALTVRGFEVRVARTARQASRLVDADRPQCAVIALKLPDASGLKLVSELIALDPGMRDTTRRCRSCACTPDNRQGRRLAHA